MEARHHASRRDARGETSGLADRANILALRYGHGHGHAVAMGSRRGYPPLARRTSQHGNAIPPKDRRLLAGSNVSFLCAWPALEGISVCSGLRRPGPSPPVPMSRPSDHAPFANVSGHSSELVPGRATQLDVPLAAIHHRAGHGPPGSAPTTTLWPNGFRPLPRRLIPVGVVPVADVAEGVAELGRLAKLGFRAATIPTYPDLFDLPPLLG